MRIFCGSVQRVFYCVHEQVAKADCECPLKCKEKKMAELTHINEQGRAKMVDVSEKADTKRIGVASGRICMQPETFALITDGKIKKGDVLAVAQVAGVMAAKKTWEIIPMCHPLLLTGVDIHFELYPEDAEIEAIASVRTTGKTGIEMEALHAVSAALLTIYDMCKAVDRGMVIKDILLLEKDGGKSGHYMRG